MWKCPVCDHQQENSLLCTVCGFDGSQDVEQFPTLAPLTVPHDAVSKIQSVWGHALSCPACQNRTFLIYLDRGLIQCTACQHQMALALGNTPVAAEEEPVPETDPTPIPMGSPVALGWYHTAVLQPDGTVRSVGYNHDDQCRTQDWTDVVALAAGPFHTVGLRKDGTVVATGQNDQGQCMTQTWTDVVAIAAQHDCTVGLRRDGSILVAGRFFMDSYCQDWRGVQAIGACFRTVVAIDQYGSVYSTDNSDRLVYRIDLWQNATALACEEIHFAALLQNGRVEYTGDASAVKDWREITAIAAGSSHIAGLRSDGTVVSTINGVFTGHDVSRWKNITAIAAGEDYTMGLRSDGTVVATGSKALIINHVRKWRDVVAIYCSKYHAVGIRKDGTLVAAGGNTQGECRMDSLRARIPTTSAL